MTRSYEPCLLIHVQEALIFDLLPTPLLRLCLQVQALRLTVSLRLKNTLPCSPEVLHVDTHTTLTEGHETGFGADGLDISTGEVVLLVDELVEIDVHVERHLRGVESEDLLLGGFLAKISFCIYEGRF
jgi:hypothetical protein